MRSSYTSDRHEADARTERLALHSDWNPWPAQRDGARMAYAASLRKHLIADHHVSPDSVGKSVKALQVQHHEVHAQEGTSEGVSSAPLGESDVHVPHFLPNFSVDYAGQPSKTGQSAAMEHTHPKGDDGATVHTHSASATTPHGHAIDDPLNGTGVPLLP
ncbi:MAG: hypothetical protein ACRDZY_11715, partial [Acidimicrobiales bacterium]